MNKNYYIIYSILLLTFYFLFCGCNSKNKKATADDSNKSSPKPTIQVQTPESKPQNEQGTFTDMRDGKTYKWVKIGNQCWMAENLAYRTASGSFCYQSNIPDSLKYGIVYDITRASKETCPEGWHIPTNAEWNELLKPFTSNQYQIDLKIKQLARNGFFDSTALIKGYGLFLLGGDNKIDFRWKNSPIMRWWSASQTDPDKIPLPKQMIIDNSSSMRYSCRYYYDITLSIVNGDGQSYSCLPSSHEEPFCCYPIRCIKDSK